MNTSTEIRWWGLPYSFVENLITEFTSFHSYSHEESRTDYYLRNNLVNTGIKIREGKQEIKVKRKSDLIRPYGRIEYWVKWSHQVELDILTFSPNIINDWTPVKKERRIWYFDLAERNLSREEVGNKPTCQIEIGKVLLPGREKVFTLGLEAFGEEAKQLGALDVGLHVIEEYLFQLQKLPSFGYSEWLLNKK